MKHLYHAFTTGKVVVNQIVFIINRYSPEDVFHAAKGVQTTIVRFILIP